MEQAKGRRILPFFVYLCLLVSHCQRSPELHGGHALAKVAGQTDAGSSFDLGK
jgi:hypothetical protein